MLLTINYKGNQTGDIGFMSVFSGFWHWNQSRWIQDYKEMDEKMINN